MITGACPAACYQQRSERLQRLYTGYINMKRLVGLLAVMGALSGCASPSGQVQDHAVVTRHYQPCAFDIREADGWRWVAEPETISISRRRAEVEEAYYQHEKALMHVVCAPKSSAFAPWVQYQLNTLSYDYASFVVKSQKNFVFQNEPAHWVLYEGTLKDAHGAKHGYILFVDRDQEGLILALTADADAQHGYSMAFRNAVDAVVLK